MYNESLKHPLSRRANPGPLRTDYTEATTGSGPRRALEERPREALGGGKSAGSGRGGSWSIQGGGGGINGIRACLSVGTGGHASNQHSGSAAV